MIWDGTKPLDNPTSIHVMIYRCKDMANNCGTCLTLNDKFDCGWCQRSKYCEVKEECWRNTSSWIKRDETCPNPLEEGINIEFRKISLDKDYMKLNYITL